MITAARRRLGLALFLAGSAMASPAIAATCAGTAAPLIVGTATRVEAGAHVFSINLGAGEGVIVDLSSYSTAAKPAASDSEGDGDSAPTPPTRDLALCNASGALLAPQPGEVFEKGGSVATTPDGTRLSFVAAAPGRYLIGVDAADEAREILVRSRKLDAASAVTATRIGAGDVQGIVSSARPVTYSFAGTAGQWVELKATSENDTLLHLAGPDRTGTYSQIASNDDSDGLNPRLRRKLPITGTYYVQVDSLGDETKPFTMTIAQTTAPAAAAPPAAIRAGQTVTGSLANQDDKRLYSLPVVAGHSYRLDLTAAYDGVVAVGLPNPIESDDDDDGGFSEAKAQDTGTTGTERLTFTARGNGNLLVQIRSFGIGETDGSYTLVVNDLGG